MCWTRFLPVGLDFPHVYFKEANNFVVMHPYLTHHEGADVEQQKQEDAAVEQPRHATWQSLQIAAMSGVAWNMALRSSLDIDNEVQNFCCLPEIQGNTSPIPIFQWLNPTTFFKIEHEDASSLEAEKIETAVYVDVEGVSDSSNKKYVVFKDQMRRCYDILTAIGDCDRYEMNKYSDDVHVGEVVRGSKQNVGEKSQPVSLELAPKVESTLESFKRIFVSKRSLNSNLSNQPEPLLPKRIMTICMVGILGESEKWVVAPLAQHRCVVFGMIGSCEKISHCIKIDAWVSEFSHKVVAKLVHVFAQSNNMGRSFQQASWWQPSNIKVELCVVVDGMKIESLTAEEKECMAQIVPHDLEYHHHQKIIV